MTISHYKGVGLANVFVDGPDMRQEEDGEVVTVIRAVRRLHRAIAEALVSRPWPLSGAELRFLRTEIGQDPATFSQTVDFAPDSLVAAESGAGAIPSEVEDRIRRLVVESLELPVAMNRALATRVARPAAVPAIVIEATSERDYAARPVAMSEGNDRRVVQRVQDILQNSVNWLRAPLVNLGGAYGGAPMGAAASTGQAMARIEKPIPAVRKPADRAWLQGDLAFSLHSSKDDEFVVILKVEGVSDRKPVRLHLLVDAGGALSKKSYPIEGQDDGSYRVLIPVGIYNNRMRAIVAAEAAPEESGLDVRLLLPIVEME